MGKEDEVIRLLETCSDEERKEVFLYLRKTIPIHRIEEKLNTQAEVILEAIDRASDLTLRGIRGIITEAAFLVEVIAKLKGWQDVTPPGDLAYDFLLEDRRGRVGIQVKMQRTERGLPKETPTGKWVAETQRTRGGTNQAGQATRPYRFGEFDILAVSLHPSTRDWSKFMYTVGNWLLPRPNNSHLLKVMQPVAKVPNEDWTDDLNVCIKWFRSNTIKTITP
jgi:hypothetical protein